MSLTLLLISIIVCMQIMFIIHRTVFVFRHFRSGNANTDPCVPLNPLSETLVTLSVDSEEELQAIQGGVVRMRAALRYENLSFCLRLSGWTWCISGEEILGTGPLSFTFLALLPPQFAS